MTWFVGVFVLYLIAIQVLEFFVIWSIGHGEMWMKTRSKFFLKCCRVSCWQLPALADMTTAALSRADLFTDVGFISIVSKCGDHSLFVTSLILFIIGVIGLQFLVPFLWSIYVYIAGIFNIFLSEDILKITYLFERLLVVISKGDGLK